MNDVGGPCPAGSWEEGDTSDLLCSEAHRNELVKYEGADFNDLGKGNRKLGISVPGARGFLNNLSNCSGMGVRNRGVERQGVLPRFADEGALGAFPGQVHLTLFLGRVLLDRAQSWD